MQITMRDAFFDELYKIAKHDSNVILLSGDCGAPSLDKFREDIPEQFVNIGISEQNMISAAAGLALSGKKVYCYAITPFLTMRCYDQIRIDICEMNLSVTLVGVGVGYAYEDAGDTHYAPQDIAIMRVLPNLIIWSPSDSGMAVAIATESYLRSSPQYIRLDRTKHELIKRQCYGDGLNQMRIGKDAVIITTGYMVSKALEVADKLSMEGKELSVFDVYRLKPINPSIAHKYKQIITIEEHYLAGGLGSIIAEIISDLDIGQRLKRFGFPLEFSQSYGGRAHLHNLAKLDVESMTKTLLEWLN
jgi:transketolase